MTVTSSGPEGGVTGGNFMPQGPSRPVFQGGQGPQDMGPSYRYNCH